MLLREVNGELVRKFDLYLKTEKHCAQNTVIRYMKCFKKVINLAIANEWLTKEPVCRNQVSRGGGKQTVPKPNRDKPDMAERVQD